MKADDLQKLVKDGKISTRTMERVNIAKSYIEKKYSMKKEKEEEKKKNWEHFEKKMDECNLSTKEKDLIKKDVLHKEAEMMRLK
jgi:serine/threonine kinase 38